MKLDKSMDYFKRLKLVAPAKQLPIIERDWAVIKYASAALLAAISIGLVWGGFLYPGNTFVYAIFCVVFALAVAAIPYGRFSWVYSCLAVFWFLGYPIKVALHLLSGNYYAEPIGYFGYTAAAYDQALVTAICGACGLLLAKALLLIRVESEAKKTSPRILLEASRLEVAGFIVVSLTLSIANIYLGIFHVGLAAQTVLPYKLTSLVFWSFNFGVPAWLTFILWRFAAGSEQRTNEMVALILATAFLVSISIFSRGPFIFLAAPLLYVLLSKLSREKSLGYGQIAKYIAAYCLAMGFALIIVSFFRATAYEASAPVASAPVASAPVARAPVAKSAAQAPGMEAAGSDGAGGLAVGHFEVGIANVRTYWFQLSLLFVDRWIGFEGVAATSSYPERGWALMRDGLIESRTLGSAGMYQHIAQSPFAVTYKEGYQQKRIMGSEPGLVGFLFYSGKFWFVVMMVCLIVSVAVVIERITSFVVSDNPYFVIFVGVSLANMLMQFTTPKAHGVYVIEMLGTISLMGLVSRYCRRAN